MIQQIAIGETTGKIYARGTHAECSRRLNRTKQFLKEPIRIVSEHRKYEILEKQIRETVPVKSEKKVSRMEWTNEKNDFIVENTDLHVEDLTASFNKHFNTNATKAAINTRRTSLRSGVFTVSTSKSRPWTDEDMAFLVENYGKLTMSEIARRVHRSRNTVKTKATRMGLGDVKE